MAIGDRGAFLFLSTSLVLQDIGGPSASCWDINSALYVEEAEVQLWPGAP